MDHLDDVKMTNRCAYFFRSLDDSGSASASVFDSRPVLSRTRTFTPSQLTFVLDRSDSRSSRRDERTDLCVGLALLVVVLKVLSGFEGRHGNEGESLCSLLGRVGDSGSFVRDDVWCSVLLSKRKAMVSSRIAVTLHLHSRHCCCVGRKL